MAGHPVSCRLSHRRGPKCSALWFACRSSVSIPLICDMAIYTNCVQYNWFFIRMHRRHTYLHIQVYDETFVKPLSLDLLWEYRIQHGTNGPLYVTSSYSTWILCRGVSGFATDCPCGVWCRGLTTCLLHVGPPFGNRILNNSLAVGLT